MNIEKNRLRTFEGWPANVAVEPQRIAKAGFFSTGQGLEVQCFSCGGKISEWNYSDQVMARHRTLDPDCPFVKNPAESGNVPMIPGDTTPPSVRSSEPDGERPSSSRSTVGDPGTWDQGARYRSEAARLESFRSWPIPFIVAPERLARAGFFNLQQGDRVQCAFCSGVVGHWEAGDDPSTEHQRHFPNCPLHLNLPVGNIPLVQSAGRVQQYVHDHRSVTVGELRPCSPAEQNVSGHGVMKEHYMNELGIQTHHGPRHPKYSTVESRLRTFTDWSPDMSQTPQQLAQAGFYHIGMNDQVRCFYCDGGLRHWEPGDDPWVEHARWFSQCGYVRLVKGDEFVQQSIAQHPPVLPTSGEADDVKTVTVAGHHKMYDVTEEQLEGLMRSAPASVALHVGLDASRIKLALRHKMEQTGMPFTTPDALIEAALLIQMNEETADTASSSTSSREASPVQSAHTDSEEEGQQPMPQSKPQPNTSCLMPVLSNQQEVPPPEEASTKSAPQLPSTGGGSSKAKDDGVALSLEEEVRRLKEARLCKICMDEEVGVVFLPCGHLVTCVNCAPSLHDCPMCRQLIKATVRTFLA